MPSEPSVLIERDFPAADCDPHQLHDNIHRGRAAIRSRVPARYRDAAATEPAVIAWVRDLVADAVHARPAAPAVATGPSLLLLGATGKTHQAYGAIRAIALSGVACHWTVSTAPDLYAALRPRPGIDAEATFRRYATRAAAYPRRPRRRQGHRMERRSQLPNGQPPLPAPPGHADQLQRAAVRTQHPAR